MAEDYCEAADYFFIIRKAYIHSSVSRRMIMSGRGREIKKSLEPKDTAELVVKKMKV